MDRQDILIRLLKEGHITEDEFKFLYHEYPNSIIRGDNVTFTPFPNTEIGIKKTFK